MTRLATLSHARIVSSGCALSLFAAFGCGGSDNGASAGSGGSVAAIAGGTTSTSIGGTASLVTTTGTAVAEGGGSATNSTASGGTATTIAPITGGTLNGTTTPVNTGGTSLASSGSKAAPGGTQAQSSGGASAASGGTRVQASGGTVTSSGGTRAQVSSTGGVSAMGGTSAAAGASGKASGGTSASTTTASDAAPSQGCGSTSTLTNGQASITVNGTSRDYILKLPANYDPQHPYRLIFAFHGRQYTAQSVADGGPPGSGPFYGIESEANGGAIFVAPQALSSSWSNDSDRDVAFVTEMVSRFESQLCIDKNRIFATGFSMGAIMTIALGCEKADVFRAIAPMSGKIQGDCTGSHGIAYWASHGNNDTTILPKDGEAARDVFVTRNGCTKQTTAGAPEGCVNYVGCDTKYPTTWCTFDGVHEPAPFAGTAIWAFLSQF